MASNRDNIIFEKTSFLQGGNSTFIKELYLQYLKDPTTIPPECSPLPQTSA